MAAPSEIPAKRCRWFRFSLATILVFVTLCCLYLGWRFRVTPEEIALRDVRSKLDGIFYVWQQPVLKKMAPGVAEYQETVKLKDGATRTETHYHNNPYLLVPSDKAAAPQPDVIDRLLGREPRVHVFAVLLPNYNVNANNLRHLKRLPYLQYVIVRNQYEPPDGPTPAALKAVREALPGVNVVGELWKLHPKNQRQ